tara:strand:+ start:115 stop:603 length:489 start_codon:yes stop_codon:yes gene_type:complete
MNVYLSINDIKKNNNCEIDLRDYIRYLYPKKNTIMDGEFTKILFSKEYVTMNGLYFFLPFLIDYKKSVENSHIRFLMLHNKQNVQLVNDLKSIENNLLKNYSNYYRINKEYEYILAKQLSTNQIRVYHDHSNKHKKNKYVIKISGIWETSNKIGLTYKILEL